jgi:hypothetical protein
MDYRYGNGTTEDAGATFHIGCGGEICWFKEGPICSKCEASDDEPGSLDTLARNLAVAGGLCAAFRLGTQWPYCLDADDMDDDYSWSVAGAGTQWRPGCGRAVR